MQDSKIWTEKYRPSKFAEIAGQKNIVQRIEAFVKQKNLPHLLFVGPAGTGKTTLSLVTANALFKKEKQQNFLELNASVTGDTPILIKENDKVKRTNFQYLAEKHFRRGGNEKRVNIKNLKILSIKKDHTIAFLDVNYMFRHHSEDIINIRYEGGKIKTSPSHSIMVLNENGDIINKKAEDIKKGELLITFKTETDGGNNSIDLTKYKPRMENKLRSGLIKNPKIKTVLSTIPLDENISWAFGLYTAEGCTSLNNRKSGGQTIFTLAYPKEINMGVKIGYIFNEYNIHTAEILGKSGFDRTKKSSMQYHILNTQLTKFFRDNFYNADCQKLNCWNKRIPNFFFDATMAAKKSFLRGYADGDGCGEWGSIIRISSRSKECLIDTVWLSRLSGLESSYFDTEARIIWKNQKFSYIKSELLPANLFIDIAKKTNNTYKLRHSLYYKKNSRISKSIAKDLLDSYKKEDEIKEKLTKLVNSDLSVVKITSIKKEKHNDYVYDVSVPESQTFWGGTTPILLHNSDERGIDVIRNKVKDFARTKALAEVPFKLVYLDECDSLTREAQQALRRTMESYSNSCRFILSCNYSSKIIDPIKSRCALFKFRPLGNDDLKELITNIENLESLKITSQAKELLIKYSEGDVRQIYNLLQSSSVISKNIDESLILEIAKSSEPIELLDSIELAVSGDFAKARRKLLETILTHGLSGIDVIKQLQKNIWNLKIPEEKKLALIEKCGEVEFHLVEGSDEFIQLESLLAYFTLMAKKEAK